MQAYDVPRPGEREGDAEAEYEACRSCPAAWVHTLAWANREEKRRACEEGNTGWLVGVSGDGRETAALRMGCGCRDCDRCGYARAAEIRRRIDGVLDARPSIMLTLTLAHEDVDRYEAWGTIAACWRRCWERLCRRMPEQLTEKKEQAKGEDRPGNGVGVPEGDEGKIGRGVVYSKRPFPIATDDGQFQAGPAPAGPWASLEPKEVSTPRAKKSTRIPQAWVIEAHRDGYPHMHVALGVAWLGTKGHRDGYDALHEEWWLACQWVTGRWEAGGWVFISGPREGDRTPGAYLSEYVTKGKNAVPEEVRAYLWGEGRRMFGATGAPRHRETPEEKERRERKGEWSWEKLTKSTLARPEARAMAAIWEAGRNGAVTTAWSKIRLRVARRDLRCVTIGTRAYYITHCSNKENGVLEDRIYATETTDRLGTGEEGEMEIWMKESMEVARPEERGRP